MIPTAQDFINLFGDKYIEQQIDAMCYFAKMHVQEALKEASENAELMDIPFTNDIGINRKSILNAYPLSNIK